MGILTTDNPYVDFDIAIDSLVARYAERATDSSKGPRAAAQAIEQLQKQLNSLYSKYLKFEEKVIANKAAKLNLGFGEVFTVAKAAGITDLQSRYKSFDIARAPDATGLILGFVEASAVTLSRTTFTEAPTNDGSVLQSLTVTLTGDTFKGVSGATLGTINDLPGGLTARLTKTTATTATLTLTGKATDHASEDTVSNVVIDFSAADFTSGSIAGKAGLSQSLTFRFFDILASEASGLLDLDAAVEVDVTVDLTTNKLLFAGAENILQSGSMSSVTRVDASGLTGEGSVVNIYGNSSANTITTSNLDGSITGGAGNDTITLGTGTYTVGGGDGDDTITLGSGVTTLRFEASPTANDIDTITGFNVVGDSLDILDFSAFLGAATTRTPSLVDASGAAGALVNGGVMILYGNALTTAAAIVAEVAATTNGKTVIISADVAGDAIVWFVTNTGADPTQVLASEVVQVATLVGVNNLALTDNRFTADNFL